MNNDTLNHVYKLKDITRYNSRTKLTQESVAEHSFFVSLIALAICDKYKLSNLLKLEVLIKAILHDTPKIDLNDITYDVKEKLNLRPLLKQYEDEYFKKHYKKYSKLMCNSDGDVINLIVNMADAMSVLQYINREIILGNACIEMQIIKDETEVRIKTYEKRLEQLIFD